jgi:hypothetical protein
MSVIPTGSAKFALVIGERPTTNTSDVPVPRWSKFLSDIQKNIQPCAEIQKIHENVWLIPLGIGIPFLGQLIEWAGSYQIPLRILFLDAEPDWIKYPPDSPKTAEKSAA